MIVGFPGETEEDFETLCRFVEAAEFDHLGVFLYSNEETSGSFHLPNRVPASTARLRQRRLMKLQTEDFTPEVVRSRGSEVSFAGRGRLIGNRFAARGKVGIPGARKSTARYC